MLAKKSLGQNFLKSKDAINKIIEISNIEDRDIIIEIGPGTGSLTQAIINKIKEKNCLLIAIEKDDRLLKILEEQFEENLNKDFLLINKDILDININELLNKIQNITKYNNIKVIANIPYYITGAIIKKFVDENIVQSMTLLVQKEVADRIVSKDNKSSILSLSINSFGNAKYVKKVEAKYFNPKPKVDSAIIYIQKHQNLVFTKDVNKELYFEIIKNGLQYKRKTLFNNLKNFLIEKNIEEDTFKIVLKKINLDINIRGEDIKFEKWLLLTEEIQKQIK
jgi:16S rRNA (adenine1518-N6/adenine1519-N6)-dimethyltransferase